MPTFGRTSNEHLDQAHPDLQRLFMDVVEVVDCKVTYGVRTEDEQQALFAQGRTAPGEIVTYCDGVTKKSNHQAKEDGFAHAVDVVPYFADAPHIRWEDEKRFHRFAGFVEATALRRGIRVKWGGDFTRRGKPWPDLPHWELIS